MTKQNNFFTWTSILKIALEHGKNFALANIIAVIKTLQQSKHDYSDSLV